ncbi:MAG TPA: phosphohistidine phosphatase SixA [Phycisphaerae bacterium]|nr:phosphohistidine phosphatase SixA [Phycisphaerae bacterium]
MLIYVVRHAIAFPHGTPEYEEDERPLTEQGRNRMCEIVRGLSRLRIKPDRIVTSPLPRARQTAEILSGLRDFDGEIEEFGELAPQGDHRRVVNYLSKSKDQLRTLALVGHEPNLSELIGFLLTGRPESVVLLKKGAVACLQGEEFESSLQYSLQWLLQPRILRQL